MLRYIFTILTCTMIIPGAFAQDFRRDQADVLFQSQAYAQAAEIYEKLESSGLGDMETKVRVALCYYYVRDFVNALQWLKKASEINQLSNQYLALYADLLRSTGERAAADSLYLVLAGKDKSFQKRAQLWSEKAVVSIPPSSYKVENIPGFNTPEDEMCPVYYRDGLAYLSSTLKKKKPYARNGRNWLAIQYVPYKPKGGEKAKGGDLKGPFNDFYHSGPVSFARNDNLMFFSKSTATRSKTDPGSANLGIFYSGKRSGKWQPSKGFKYNSKKFSISHPTVNADGREMYFASDMPGGYGGTDIYYTKYSGSTWTTPVNLGSVINTSKNDMFPFLHKDGILYFASEGHPGFGGLDIFYSRFENGAWTIPVNMGKPVNSGFDDFGIVLDAKMKNGYFTSNRPGGMGNDDIYRLVFSDLTDTCYYSIGGLVSDKLTLAAIVGADVSFVKEDGTVVSIASTDAGGFYLLKVPCKEAQVVLRATAVGYFPFNTTIDRKGEEKEIPLNIYLNKVELNKAIIVPNIYYDLDKAEIRPDAAKELDKLVSLLKRNPDWIVEIGSHTDSRADQAYNLRLSERRARAAVDYLISKGVAESRLYARGYGEGKLINDCKDGVKCSEEKHAMNRRTEFRLVGYERFLYEDEGKQVEAGRVIFAEEYAGSSQSLVYKIQVGVFTGFDPAFLQTFSDLGNVKSIPVEGTPQVRYFLESYDSYATAQGYLKKVQNRGIKDAFITAFKDGVQISVQEARALEGR